MQDVQKEIEKFEMLKQAAAELLVDLRGIWWGLFDRSDSVDRHCFS